MLTENTTPEQQLHGAILARFRSVRAFATFYALPYSTVDNVFKRGVHSVSISTASTLCDALGLDLAAFGQGMITPRQSSEEAPDAGETALVGNYRVLDSYGKALVGLVAEKERERCDAAAANTNAAPKALRPAFGQEGWRQYLGTPIACRGGGIIAATEEDARQMERIYSGLLDDNNRKK